MIRFSESRLPVPPSSSQHGRNLVNEVNVKVPGIWIGAFLHLFCWLMLRELRIHFVLNPMILSTAIKCKNPMIQTTDHRVINNDWIVFQKKADNTEFYVTKFQVLISLSSRFFVEKISSGDRPHYR